MHFRVLKLDVSKYIHVKKSNKFIEQVKMNPDKMSVYSLYMVPDLRYYFQHPYARLFIAYLITVLNFYM